MNMKLFYTLLICLWLPTWVSAKTADEILAQNLSPEKMGLAIAEEADERDLGFVDTLVDMEMVLRNAQGQSSNRKLRMQILEIPSTAAGDKSMIIFDNPRDIKGTALLTHSKILQADDQWLYLPALKRVKRISSKNKSGSFVGSEFAYEDLASQEVGKYRYKYIGQDNCSNLQCFKVERFPLYKHSGYTKQVAWIDTKEFRIQKITFFDKKSSHLKTLTFHDYKQYLGKFWRPNKMAMKNHQTGKSTDLIWKNYRFKTGLTAQNFVKDKLKRVR